MSPNLCRLAGASPAALALALAAVPALAQSFDATGNVVSGLATITTLPNQTQVTIDSPEVVINWFPNDVSNSGPILFQPGGTTAIFDTFVSSNVTDYVVLNRIYPTSPVGAPINQPVRFAGTVESRVQGTPGRGNLWFYSPTGIIIGNGAAFNVGSLVLTTSTIDTTGGLFGPGNTIRFAGPTAPASFVQVDPTASLTVGAGGNPSYIALVAPRIVQSGTIDANGQVALVAAETADISINAGLLDIVVTQGSGDANGIVHSGNTTGAASTAIGDIQQIQFVAIPKNTAMTMLLSGSIGYVPATTAADDGSAIILSAGVAANIPQATQDLGLGNMAIANTAFRNVVNGAASNTVDILPVAGLVDFQAGGTLTAGLALNAIAEGGEAIQATGNLVLRALRPGAGGTVTIRALGGTLPGVVSATGALVADASGQRGLTPPLVGQNSLGGTIIVDAAGGEISATTMDFNAPGFGGEGLDSGGNGRGGSVAVTVSSGGTLTAGAISLNADGGGGNGLGIGGGDGTGGSTSLRVVNGTMLAGTVSLAARGFGGASAAQNGSGFGGTSLFEVLSGTPALDGLFIDSAAQAGEPFITGSTAGNARGAVNGAVLHVGNGASLTVNGAVIVEASAIGAVDAAPGGFAEGGEARVLVDGGGSLTTTSLFEVDGRAEISDESFNPDALTTPRVQGGTASVIADGGTIASTELTVRSHAIGASTQVSAGTATGGTSQVIASNAGSVTIQNPTGGGDLLIDAEGYGAMGTAPAAGRGGTARLVANDATITVRGTTRITANATDGRYSAFNVGRGYDSTGGTALAEIEAGTTGTGRLDLATLFVQADGNASGPTGGLEPIEGDGGAGNGGTATLAIRAGTLTAGNVHVQALGLGGNSAAGLAPTVRQSGTGTGGTARLVLQGGTATTGTLQILAQGTGGSWFAAAIAGQLPARGGNGLGGTAEASLSGGTLSAPSLLVAASGLGGRGMDADTGLPDPGSNGGNGTGGTALFAFATGSTGTASLGSTIVTAHGRGGNGGLSTLGLAGTGGNGTGGLAAFDAGGGGFSLAPLLIDADGTGGDGETGGNGSGGSASFRLADGNTAAAYARLISNLNLRARGIAGTGLSGPAPVTTAGSTAFTSQVAAATARLTIGTDLVASALGQVAPAGSGFAANVTGQGPAITGNVTIQTSRDVSIAVGAGAVFGPQGVLSIQTPRGVTSTGVVSAGGNVSILADQGLTMSDLRSGGTTLLRAINGPVTIGTDLRSNGLVTAQGRSVDILGTGALSFADADATAGNLRVQTGGNLGVATVDATGAITLTAGGTLAADGLVRGDTITLTSGNIAIGTGGRIGQRGFTRTVTLVNGTPANRTFIGGADSATGYSLSNVEARRLFADNGITFAVPATATATGTGDFIIGDLAMSYGPLGLPAAVIANVGTGGAIKVTSPARVSVIGQVRLTTSSAADLFSIDPARIEVVGDTGSIAMRNAGGSLLGRLELVGDTILAGTAAAIAAVDGVGTVSAATRLLDAPGTVASDGGFLQAGSLELSASNGIYIQNTGASSTFPARRGFSANSLSITTRAPDTRIAINGQLFDPAGVAITGLQTLRNVRINGIAAAAGGSFDPRSTVNGCIIGRSCQTGGTPLTPSDINGKLQGGDGGIEFMPVVELRQEEGDNLLPLIDEPVTGVGNDDLWQADCDEQKASCGVQGGND